MAIPLMRGAFVSIVILLLSAGCGRRVPTWDNSGILVCSTSSEIIKLDLETALVDTVMTVGSYGGPNAPASMLGKTLVVYSDSPMQGGKAVVVYDMTRKVEVARYPGIQGISAGDENTIVFWRMSGPRRAILVWQDLRGPSGVIGEVAVEGPGWLDAPVAFGDLGIVAALNGRVIQFDPLTRRTRELPPAGVVPLCDAGMGRLLCRRSRSEEIVLVDVATAEIKRSYGQLVAVGWARDSEGGGVLCSVPSGQLWRPEEYDLGALDLVSGRVIRGIPGIGMTGGVVVHPPPIRR